MDMPGSKGGVIEQTFPKMREISILIPCRRHAFVHLHDMDVLPRELFLGQGAEHDPGSTPAAHGHNELTASGDASLGCRGNKFSRRLSGGFVVGEYLKVHPGFSGWISISIARRASTREDGGFSVKQLCSQPPTSPVQRSGRASRRAASLGRSRLAPSSWARRDRLA